MSDIYARLQEREDSVPPERDDWDETIRYLDAAIRRDRKPRRLQRRRAGHARPYRSRLAWSRARNGGV